MLMIFGKKNSWNIHDNFFPKHQMTQSIAKELNVALSQVITEVNKENGIWQLGHFNKILHRICNSAITTLTEP